MWEMAQVFDKRLKCVGNGLEIWEIAQIYLARLKYLRNGISMLQMT